MKKFFRYGAVAMVALLLSVVAAGCSKSPVDQMISQIDKATAAVKSADSEAELQNAFKDIEAPAEGIDKDYKLTEEDKEALKKSFGELFEAMGKKAEELTGQENASMGVAIISAIIDGAIDKSETAGDLEANMQSLGNM